MARPRKKKEQQVAVLEERAGQYFIVKGKNEVDAGRSRRYAEKLLKETNDA
jgi:hypothetical protein